MAVKTNVAIGGHDYYQVKRKIGVDQYGQAVYKKFYGKSKGEALQKWEEYKREQASSPAASDDDSLGKLAFSYTYEIMPNEGLSPASVSLYESVYRRYFKESDLAIVPASKVHPSRVQKYLNKISSSGSIAPSSMAALGKWLNRFFRFLNVSGYCLNVMNAVMVPKIRNPAAAEKGIEFFSEDEVEKILSPPSRLHFLYVLAFATGLREGELLGLKYSDIENGYINVRRSLNSRYDILPDGSKVYLTDVKEPKTPSSYRKVPLPDTVLDELTAHRELHEREMEVRGYRTEYVFTTSAGKFIEKSNFITSWKRHLKRCGVRYLKFHACRATYCTMLCRRGIPLETASQILGHSSVNVTAQYYRAVGSDELRSAADVISDLFKSAN